MNIKNFFCLAMLPMAALTLGGCGAKLASNEYSVSEVGKISQVRLGRVLSVRPIEINSSDPSKPGFGTLIGGLAGAGLGSTIGQGKGQMIGSVLGGLTGATAGHFAQQGLTKTSGFEYSVQLESGNTIVIAQAGEHPIRPGTNVQVIDGTGSARSRIIPVESALN